MSDPTTTPSTSPISSADPGVVLGSLESDPTIQAAIAAEPKSALATTELFVTIFLNLVLSAKASGIVAAGGATAQYIAFIAMTAYNTIYLLARTQLKKAHVNAAALVAATAASLPASPAPTGSSFALATPATTPSAPPAPTAAA
jgi:hypothetical protein